MKTDKNPAKLGFATKAIHHGYNPLDYHGALNPPIFQSSTFAFENSQQGEDLFAGDVQGYFYSRIANPTLAILENRLAALEGAEAGLVTSSGMGAINAVFWTLLSAGDEIIADKTLYGCTFSLLKHQLVRFGIKTHFIDMSNLFELEAAISDKTKIVYCETPANPNMKLIDIKSVATICKKFDKTFIVDNTYCTPYLQNPIELGADYVVHSATKYLGGHGDLTAGAVVGRKEDIDQVRFVGLKDLTGAVLSSHDASLILRGLKTLNLRMDRHCESALKLATELENHPLVSEVFFPGLTSSPFHELAKQQMKQFGGMIAFELTGGLTAGKSFIDNLELIIVAVSLGDAETLVQHPASMTHSTYEPEERIKHGFTDGLIRLSVGLEDYEDIKQDIFNALELLDGAELPYQQAG
ncbi:MAG: methionine gamma-lyase [Rhizobiales bacterium]|nr:methionine gamma-lyase [Hyphomicrobiales bacterium]NRB12897.1 methionine gamma-lyase [Hyphomicrobiales bacterium]